MRALIHREAVLRGFRGASVVAELLLTGAIAEVRFWSRKQAGWWDIVNEPGVIDGLKELEELPVGLSCAAVGARESACWRKGCGYELALGEKNGSPWASARDALLGDAEQFGRKRLVPVFGFCVSRAGQCSSVIGGTLRRQAEVKPGITANGSDVT